MKSNQTKKSLTELIKQIKDLGFHRLSWKCEKTCKKKICSYYAKVEDTGYILIESEFQLNLPEFFKRNILGMTHQRPFLIHDYDCRPKKLKSNPQEFRISVKYSTLEEISDQIFEPREERSRKESCKLLVNYIRSCESEKYIYIINEVQ